MSDLSPCTETALMTPAVMSQYVHWSGDVAGVVVDASGAGAEFGAGATCRK